MGQSQPKPVEPTLYRTKYPQRDYKAAAKSIGQSQERTAGYLSAIQQLGGLNPAQVGAQSTATNTQAAANYLASLPPMDQYAREATGGADLFAAARQAAESRYNLSKSYSDQAAKAAEAYVPVPEEPIEFGWLKHSAKDNKKDKTRMAGDQIG